MYSQKVLDHFHHPRNAGEIENASVAVEMTNPVCGDLLKLWLAARQGRIEDAKFKVQGCIPAVACASWLTEAVRGKTLAEARSVTPEQIESGLGGLPSASRHAATLAAAGLERALAILQKGAGAQRAR